MSEAHKIGLLPSFAQKIRNERCVVAWGGIASAQLVETLMGEDYDGIVLDGQHGHFSKTSLIECIGAAAMAGKAAIPRIPVGDFAMASQLCDAGAAGIIAPMINSVEDAKRFAAFMKFPSVGERSWAPNRALALSDLTPADYFARANDFTLAIPMIETKEALAVADEILAVPGIDGFLIGPTDLSISIFNGTHFDVFAREVDDALSHVLKLAQARGKFACCFAPNAARAAELSKRGYNMVCAGTDFGLLSEGSREALKIARAGARAKSASAIAY